jgi:hypothetical protein
MLRGEENVWAWVEGIGGFNIETYAIELGEHREN